MTRIIEGLHMGKGRWGRVLGVLLLASGASCSGSAAGKDVSIRGGADAGVIAIQGIGVGQPSGDGPGVLSVSIPSGAAGVIPLALSVVDHRAQWAQIEATVSLDQGATWRPAHMRLANSDAATVGTKAFEVPASGAGVTTPVSWDSVADLGFHAPRSGLLRLVPSDATGAGTPAQLTTPVIDNLWSAARRVDHYLINYGGWDAASIAIAKQHQLVVVRPDRGNLDRAAIADVQAGVDPADPADDVIVLGYVSAGEDLRAAPLSDDQVRADSRFAGDRSGPRADPRGPSADGQSLQGIKPLGIPSNGGTGFASYYLDDNSIHDNPNHVGDGFPDRNQQFGGLFVNAGDPKWFTAVDAMTLDSPDAAPGLRETLTTGYGRGLGCDGVFLDTIDTAAPNTYTSTASSNESKFEWTAPGFSAFIHHVRQAYPDRLILQNRGLFFFDPQYPHYAFTPRGDIDFVLFESYRLSSSAAQPINPFFYPDNRYDVAPRLMAEANRPDGFRVLSLGYATAPSAPPETLLGASTTGLDSLLEDIRVTEQLAGFRHYITDATVKVVNGFVTDHADLADHTPPIWTSTYNPRTGPTPTEPAARVGIQEVVPGRRQLTVRWDVALDMNPVKYALYYQTTPFDFAADPKLAAATRVELTPAVPVAYAGSPGPDRFPYEATVGGLAPGTLYYLVIRAFDTSPGANQDANTVVLTATPTS
jgi:hypothetical protein